MFPRAGRSLTSFAIKHFDLRVSNKQSILNIEYKKYPVSYLVVWA